MHGVVLERSDVEAGNVEESAIVLGNQSEGGVLDQDHHNLIGEIVGDGDGVEVRSVQSHPGLLDFPDSVRVLGVGQGLSH